MEMTSLVGSVPTTANGKIKEHEMILNSPQQCIVEACLLNCHCSFHDHMLVIEYIMWYIYSC